jgi:ABC-type molybdate transport system substrate-binding protein
LVKVFRFVVVIARGAIVSTSDTVPVAVAPVESVTVTEKVNVVVAASLRVPVNTPVLDRLSPDGKSLDEKV